MYYYNIYKESHSAFSDKENRVDKNSSYITAGLPVFLLSAFS